MMKEAEANAETDKQKKQLQETKNDAEHMIYTTEKQLKEHGDKLKEDERKKVSDSIENLKSALGTDDYESLNSKLEEMKSAAMMIGKAMYQNKQEPPKEEPKEEEKEEPKNQFIDEQ